MLIAFFIIEGVVSIMFALDHKRELSGQWGWMLMSGLIDLVLAVMIFAGLPSTAAWAVGLLVGINMMFGGTALIAMALHARKGAVIPKDVQALLRFAGFHFGQLGAPVRALEQEGVGGKREQADADDHQAG